MSSVKWRLNFGVRSGFVWNAWRQGYGVVNTNAPFDAFNIPVTVPVPGPDGLLTDSTERSRHTIYRRRILNLPLNQVVQNSSLYDSDWYTWEITATRREVGRWSMIASFFKTWSRESPFGVTADQSESISPYTNPTIVNPNVLINTSNGRDDFSNWGFKVNGTLSAWKGVRFLPTFSSQSGWAFARTFTTSLNYNPGFRFTQSRGEVSTCPSSIFST